jgi:hypothetical protein
VCRCKCVNSAPIPLVYCSVTRANRARNPRAYASKNAKRPKQHEVLAARDKGALAVVPLPSKQQPSPLKAVAAAHSQLKSSLVVVHGIGPDFPAVERPGTCLPHAPAILAKWLASVRTQATPNQTHTTIFRRFPAKTSLSIGSGFGESPILLRVNNLHSKRALSI